MKQETMTLPISRLVQTTGTGLLAVVLVVMMLFIGCDGDDVTGPDEQEIDQVVISPNSVSMPVGELEEFSFFLLSADGDTIPTDDLNMETEWISTDPDVFTVEDDGTAMGQSPGEEYCIINVTVHHGESNFTGRDSAFVAVF